MPARSRRWRQLSALRLPSAPEASATPSRVQSCLIARWLRFLEAANASFDHVALRRRRWFDVDGWFGFVSIVLLPTLVVSFYYTVIAADRFVSHSELVLRSPGSFNTTGLSALVAAQAGSAGGLAIGGGSDAEAVTAYIASRDAMTAADRAVDLRGVFARPEADWIAGYPAPLRSDSNYELHRYYQKMVEASHDPTTGVISLSVETFRPRDAQAMSEALIGGAEALINRIDLRARQDAIRTAREQVEAAHAEMVAAQQKLTEFRLRERMIDPIKMSGVIIEAIGQLVLQGVELRAQLSDLLKNTPGSQRASILRSQIASLEEQIVAQQRKLAGADGSLSPLLAEYARLSLLGEFANRIHTASLEQLEAARAAGAQQSAYIERISGPTLPDYSTEPKRAFMVLLTFVVLLSAWVVLRFVVQDSRVHHGR